MQIYDDLVKAKENWRSRNYSFNIYKSQLEATRDNEMNAISNLLYKYDLTKFFTDSEIRFAQKLIANSRK